MSMNTRVSLHSVLVVIRTVLVAAVVLPFVAYCSTAQAVPDTKGRDFWLAFPPNYHTDFNQGDSLYIFIAANEPTTGLIAYRNRNGTGFSHPFAIADPSKAYTFSLPWKDFELQGVNTLQQFNNNHQSGRVAAQSFHITSNSDIAVSILSHTQATGEVTAILPTDALGTDYRVLSYNSDGYTNNTGAINWKTSTPSQLAIVATQDDTHISITPSAPVFGAQHSTTTLTLNAGDAYLLQASITSGNLHGDVTGTAIQSSAPIAVFGSHQNSPIPARQGHRPSRNFLVEQMPPINAWGKKHILVPCALPISVRGTTNDVIRVLAAYDNTEVSMNGRRKALLRAGELYEAPLTTATLLATSQDVLVVQYQGSPESSDSSAYNNPLMMLVPPHKQFLSSYTCIAAQAYTENNERTYAEQLCTIVFPTDFRRFVTINKKRVSTKGARPIHNTCYSYIHTNMLDGLNLIEGLGLIGVYMHGYGNTGSYGCIGGMALSQLEEKIVANTDTIICGDSVQLVAPMGAASYHWSPSAGLSCTTCPNPVARPRQTTTYRVVVSNGGFCSYEDSVTIVVSFGVLASDTLICAQDSITFDLPKGFTYEWFPPKGLSCTDCPNPTAKPKATTTYNVIMTTKNGCVNQRTITIGVVNVPIVSLTPNTAMCANSPPIRLLAKGGNFYRWSPPDGLSCTDCPSPLAAPTTTTTYTVEIALSTTSSCRTTTTVTLTVLPAVQLALTPDTALCANTPLQLSASGAESYHWSPPDGLSCTDCANPIATPNATTTYTVVASNGDGCTAIDSVRVAIAEPSDVSISPDLLLCAGSSATLLATGGSSYHWSPPDGLSCTDCANPTASPQTTTTYTVDIANAANCTEQRAITLTVEPLPELALSRDTTICKNTSVQLQASGGTTHSWTPAAGLSCTNCPTPLAQPTTSTRYYVTAHSANGCSTTDSVLVAVRPCGLRATLSSVAFPALAMCDSATALCTLTNTGEEPLEIASWLFTGVDANAFSAELMGATLPHTLAIGESVQFRIRFSPLHEGISEAKFEITTGYRDVRISSKCTGTAYRRSVLFTLGSEIQARPGETLDFELRAQSDAWNDVAIDSVHIAIGYKASWLQYANAIAPSVDLPSGWSVQAKELPSTTSGEKTLLITAGGVSPLQASGMLATVSLRPLLSDEQTYTPTLEVQAIGREQCVAIESNVADIDLSFCAAPVRAVRYYGTTYQFAVASNTHSANAELHIQYSLGLAAPVRVELYNQLGILVAIREREITQPGSHSDVLPTHNLAAGVYMVRFSSGPFSKSVPVFLGVE